MVEYTKSPVENIITVTSIVTALRADLRNKVAGTEQHNFPEVFCMVEGQGSTQVNGKLHHLEAGQIIIYGPNSIHGHGTGGIAEIISFETDTPFPEEFCDRVITLTGSQRILLHEIIVQTIPMLERRVGVVGMILKSHVDQYAVQNTKNKLELFLLDIIRPEAHHLQDKINTVTDYMINNIHRTLTVAQISRELGISLSSLKRLVQKTYSKSPLAYFTDLKIQEAKRLMQYSSMNITEIAEQLGFSTVHYFSRVFKQKTGKTPSEYKKNPSER